MLTLTHGNLFSGIGGFELGAQRAGIKTLWQVENDKHARRILRKNFPDSKLYSDITTLDPQELESVNIISASPPCQPFSTLGKRKGSKDERNLWDYVVRILQAVKPNWVIVENVVNVVNMGIEIWLSDLEKEGYETQVFNIPAAACGANHERQRIWIVANAPISDIGAKDRRQGQYEPISGSEFNRCDSNGNAANANETGVKSFNDRGVQWLETVFSQFDKAIRSQYKTLANPSEPPLCGAINGIPNKLDFN